MLYGYIANWKWDSVSILNTSRWNKILKKINHVDDDKDIDKIKLLRSWQKNVNKSNKTFFSLVNEFVNFSQ